MTLRWNASTDDSGSIHHYVVNGVHHPGTSTQKTITGLVPSWTQSYRVSAADAAGNTSALSAPLTATTAPDLTAPTVPGGLRVTATTPSSVSLAWNASSDRWALWYEVLVDGAVARTTGGLTARLRQLIPGTHVLAVRARDSGGNVSASSAVVTVVLADTGDRIAPSAPAGLTAPTSPISAAACGSAGARWVTPPSTSSSATGCCSTSWDRARRRSSTPATARARGRSWRSTRPGTAQRRRTPRR
ncbi:hypothetical protein [Solirubrobacter phytolaccae]|uniref:hypothetical protein n=1 Tax=Solirubrobacter phytolaccae TaxID=1404360 RepID=UPI0035560234